MEQASSLTMSSQTPDRVASPAPAVAASAEKVPGIVASTDAVQAKATGGDALPAATTHLTDPPKTTAESSSSSNQEATTAQRAFQSGLSRENLEQEMNQVMGTFNSWWGGFKKQASRDPSL